MGMVLYAMSLAGAVMIGYSVARFVALLKGKQPAML
jgi:hypothetical protein